MLRLTGLVFGVSDGLFRKSSVEYDDQEDKELYNKVCKQRELERKVRASKRECMMLKDGDPEMFQKASVKLKHNTQQLKTYCSSNDLMYMNERTSVMGYGRSEAGKVTAAYNRALKQEEANFMSKVVDISGGSGIIKINKAKNIDIFNDNDLKPDDPTTTEILNELSKSAVGREITELISELPEAIVLKQGSVPELRGEERFGKIKIYVNQCRNVQWIARTIIHEYTHYRYGIGGSQWAECICIAQELKHARNRDYLTIAEKRLIVKAVKNDSDYSKLS